MKTEPVELTAEIKVGDVVRFRTGPDESAWIVVGVCRWPWRGKLILRQRFGYIGHFLTAYAWPAEVMRDD